MSTKKSDIANKSSEAKHAAKKAAVLKSEKKSRLPLLVVVAGAVMVVVIAGILFLKGSAQSPSVVTSLDQITYPVETFDDGKARHYRLESGDGTTINFFVLKSSDGVIRAAFDACDVCWQERLGYYQEGDYMICRNCGQQFASNKVNELRGGCNPGPLKRTVSDGQLVIKVKDILEGRRYFNFSARS